nr:DUF3592 domain-containing protein [uncultured Chitinophaga sp.]
MVFLLAKHHWIFDLLRFVEVFTVVPTVFGITCIVFAVMRRQHYKALLQNGISTTGTITKWKQGGWIQTDPGKSAYSRTKQVYTVSFHTREGEQLSVILNLGTSVPIYSVGDKLNIRYDPEDPHYYLADEEGRSAAPSGYKSTFFGGILFLAIATWQVITLI